MTTLTGLQNIPQTWSIEKIGDLLDRKIILEIQDGNHGELHPKQEDFVDSGIPFVAANCLVNGKIVFNKCKFLSKEWLRKLRIGFAKEDDVILTHKGTLGLAAIVPNGFDTIILTPQTTYYRLSPRLIAPFLLYVFQSNSFQKQLFQLGKQSTRDYIGITSQRNLVIPYMPVRQQQKIASILSKVDELIQKTDQIIEQTQRLRKGLMQKLLTKGIGHTKFESVYWNYGKKIEIPQEWKILFLDEVAKRGTGHTPDAKKPEYYNGDIKWVSLADSKRLDNIYISETTKEISNLGIENSSAVVHPPGTVILSRDAGIGKSAILKIEMAVSQHFIAWRCGENLNNHFLYYMLQYWKPLFESIAIGTTIKTIGLPFFRKLRIPLPSINEQQRIASILLNVDDLRQKQQIKKSKLESLKKGLMQQLLTGKIGVKL